MPRDRIGELQASKDDLSANIEITINIGETGDMTAFFAQVEDIKEGLVGLKKKVHDLEVFHSKALTAVGDQTSDAHQKQLDNLMDVANKEIQTVRAKIKAMEASNKKAGIEASKRNLTADQRMRLSQHGNVTKKFMDVVQEYQDMQNRYKNKYKDRLERQYKIVKPNATSGEIAKALESGNDGSQLFAQQILMGAQHAEAKRALYDIQERHQDIVKIEKSVLELHQLFMDMAVLVDAQGEMINQIETYVTSAADHTNKGVEEMRRAVKSQRKSRKKMCCILFIVLALVIIAIVVSIILVK